MTSKQCAGFLDQIQENGGSDVMLEMLRIMVQTVLEEGMTRHLGAPPYERSASRSGHRNGYKPRSLKTRLGELSLSIPQARGTEPFEAYPLVKWQRSERALLVACAEMYFQGVSTRKVSRVLEEMGGFELSASTVSRVAVELDERLSEFRNRRLDEVSWPFLMVDACYIKVRHHGSIKSRSVLVVAGINETGRRELLTWRVGDVESEATWSEVFSELRQRGVQGVQCVVSDGHAGIQAAAARYFNDASWQRCWTHFMRSILTKASHKDKDVLSRELIAARKIEDVKICLAEAERIATRWEQHNARIAIQIREQFEQTLAVHGLDNRQRRRVYTTNMLERVMREIKRRTRVVGIFPNDASCDRLVGAHLIEIHESWQCEKARYLCLDEALLNKRECHCKTLE
jgi:putative transposase